MLETAKFFIYNESIVTEKFLQQSVFWKDGLCFSCDRCSGCCRYDPGFVYLSPRDLQNLQTWASLERAVFIQKYCRWVLQGDGYEYLCLKELPNYDCILWDNGCIAYNYRPFQCSSYPFWDYLLENEQRWNANARSCSGINRGKWYSAEEIQGFLDTAKQFPVIRRRRTGESRDFTEK